ncbi:MAG TPA: DNA primase [Acetobacteraceae bacterium]|nr:DNA primase [Acetobacteraceae bacterium]
MALSPAFLEELRARTPLAAVVGRRVKLARSGRQMKGCCPFHNEKTPSFYVYEDGYHCFGCGAHGDAIGFVMQTQGASFIEAVAQLAAEAGLDVPQPTPEAAEAERRQHDLTTVLQAAQTSYQRRLTLPEGRHALAYLQTRGLTDETIQRFGLGWSGEGRGTLAADLTQDGITQDQLVEAGLLRRDDATGRTYDLFFNRVMFPIHDRRGRAISFGGRILGDGQPKYVNGPETALFSKRRTLYALDLAREAVRNGAALVVVEGYMDVIALHQAGFGAAVAPLGTALTEEQMEELWRLSPAPVLCFDGDAAGARAAARAAESSLPLLAPDRTLQLATLPAGEDPDTLVRRHGAAGFQAVLNTARPLAEALYDLLREATGGTSPEQRAAFRNRLDQAARRIPDKVLSDEYLDALRGRFYADRRRERAARSGHPGRAGTSPPRSQPRPQPTAGGSDSERARILTAILLRHPALLHDVDHAYAAMPLDPVPARLRDAIRGWADRADVLDSPALIDHLTVSGLQADVEQVLAGAPVPLPACASPAAMPAEAEAGWWHIFGFLNLDHLREEVKLAETAAASNLTQETQRRALSLKAALNKVMAGEPDGVELAA